MNELIFLLHVNLRISLLECLWVDTGPEQQMKPLTAQQEALLSSDDRNDEITEQANAGNMVEKGNGNTEGQIDIYRDYSSPESDNILNDYRIADDSDIGSHLVHDTKNTSNDIDDDDATKSISVQEDLQHESAVNDKLDVPSESSTPLNLSEYENTVDSFGAYGYRDFDSNPAVGSAESLTDVKENPFNVEPGSMPDDDPLDRNIEQQDEIISSSASKSSAISNNSPSSGADNETEIVSAVVNPESNNTVSNPEFFPQDDQENVLSASAKENIDLNKMPQVSTEGNKSSLEDKSIPGNDEFGKSSVSSSTNIDEQVRNDNKEVNSGSLFSAPGIPAPSVVSSAVQMHPGKVLVPATVDQVQGQALAALQVLKVTISS